MANFTTEGEDYMDIEPFEYINECSSREIQELISELKRFGYLKKDVEDKNTVPNYQWYQMVEKLKDNRHQLSVEEESIIMNIAKKIV